MEEGQPSITAMLTAMFRAAHLLWDDPPKIFEDTLSSPYHSYGNHAEPLPRGRS
jgi:hypothetical protein